MKAVILAAGKGKILQQPLTDYKSIKVLILDFVGKTKSNIIKEAVIKKRFMK